MMDLLIYLYIYDISGNGIIIYFVVLKVGVDIVDVVMSVMSGNMSQFSMSSLYYVLVNGLWLLEIIIENVQKLNYYWEDVCMYYKLFENGLNVFEIEVYMYEMLGGQYLNLQQQVKVVGLGYCWDEIK